MGNCVRKDYDNQWGGEYWGPPEKALLSVERKSEKKIVAGDGDSGDRFSSSDCKRRTSTEVKIKITKKQLEELMGMKKMHGLTLQEVLTQLMNGGDGGFESDKGSWKPALRSIPE